MRNSRFLSHAINFLVVFVCFLLIVIFGVLFYFFIH